MPPRKHRVVTCCGYLSPCRSRYVFQRPSRLCRTKPIHESGFLEIFSKLDFVESSCGSVVTQSNHLWKVPVERIVEIVGNGCTLGPQSYPSSLKSNLRSARLGIHGRTRLAQGNTDSDACIQYTIRWWGTPSRMPYGNDHLD